MKAAALAAKGAFCQRREALLHGDLHTGSCIVSPSEFYVIDSEFAFYGPMAFDVGKFMANLLLTFFALDGHSTASAPRTAQQAYALQVGLSCHYSGTATACASVVEGVASQPCSFAVYCALLVAVSLFHAILQPSQKHLVPFQTLQYLLSIECSAES